MAMPNQMLGANQANLFMAGISGQHAFPSHVQNQGLPHNSWRRDPNIFLMRRMMCKRIHAYFQRHAKYREWGDRVYNIVKKLESRLFVEAKTKLEYMDGKTLPRRLCHILKSSSKPKNPIFPSSPIHSAPPTSDQSTFSRNRPLVQIIEGTRGLGDPVKSIRTALSVPPLQNENGSVAGLSATSSLHYDAELLRYWVNLEATYWAYLEARALVQIGCKPPAATPIVEPLMKFSEENQSPAWTSTERENQKHAWKMGHREPVFTEPLTKCAEIQSPTCASMEEDDLNDACKMGHEDPVAEHFMNFQNNDYEMGREEPAAAEHLLKWVEETESPSSLRNIEGDYQNDFCKVGCEKSPLQNENGSVAGLSAASSSHYLNHMVDGIGMTVSMHPQIQNRFVDGQAAASSAHYLNSELHCSWAHSEDSALIQIGYKPPAAAPIVEPLMKFSEENQSPTWAITERDDQKHAWKMGHRELVVTEPLMKCAEIESPTCASMEEDDLNDACKMGHEDPFAEHFMNFQKNDYETGHEEPAAAEHLLKCVEETESPSSPRNIKTADQNDCCKVGHENFVDNFQNNDYEMGREEPASTEHLLKCVEETESPSSLRNMKGNDQNDCCKVGHEKSVDNCIDCEKTEFVQNFLEAPDEDIAVSGKIKEQTLSRNPKINVVSLLESFTPRQIKEHIQGLRQRINEGNSEGMEMQNVGDSVNETSCQLCAVEKHFLEPPPIYCSVCCHRIMWNQTYYTAASGEKQYYFCSKCHSMQSKKFNVDGVFIPKAHLEKQKNTEQLEEPASPSLF